MAIQKILIVDDSKTELFHLSDILGKRGYTVRTAENGEEAMRRLEEEKPTRSGACARARATTSSSPSMPTS